jgi:hypothetical protein
MINRGLPQPPIQVRALHLVQEMPSTMERAFILRWLEPRAKKAEARAQEKARVRISPWEQAKAQRKKTEASAEFKALTALSKYVRTLGTHPGPDGERWGQCVTCPNSAPFKKYADLQAGHWIKRKHQGTRYNAYNVHPQCRHCNDPARGGGKYNEHEAFIARRHGAEMPDRLRVQAETQKRKKTDAELLQIADNYNSYTEDILAKERSK